ncbi:transketolase, partial [bacterium]|nr:transketolase [candidate division CSSED10-310 bacterium]
MNDQCTLDELCINTIRFLAADAVEQAHSGHPGMPMGFAPVGYALWRRHLTFNPRDPRWPDRDRFVLSAGHGSMFLYALLHLVGYDLPMDELKRFRQWGSLTPGHPEPATPGVEVTTGPLGQGLANAVGMAIAEAHLAARFNRPGHRIVDHFTYVIAGDGDMMEGVGMEACALAGHLHLGKLVVLYDCNGTTLAGSASLSFTEDVPARFRAMGWEVFTVPAAQDLAALDRALDEARADSTRPSLIVVNSTIGFGAPTKQGSYKAHGAPLGAGELAGAKAALGWPQEPAFLVPDEARAVFAASGVAGTARQADWNRAMEAYRASYPAEASELERRWRGELPEGWERALPEFAPDARGVATRKTSEQVLQQLGEVLPELMGGSADLNTSVFTWLNGLGDFQAPREKPAVVQGSVGGPWGYDGRTIHFGVREHAMGAIANGMALHGGIIPFTGTFFVFSDYMRPPMRLAALMGIRVVFVFTHDSFHVGEDGPTHQPVEHLAALRAVPNLHVIRPADANEVVEAWRVALTTTTGPTVLVLSRQNLPTLDRGVFGAAAVNKGAYVLWQSAGSTPDLVLIASGSE